MKKTVCFMLVALMTATASTGIRAEEKQTGTSPLAAIQETNTENKTTASLDKIQKLAENNKKSLFTEFDEDQTKSLEKLLYSKFDASKDKEVSQKIQALNLKEFREKKKELRYNEALSDLDFLMEYIRNGYSGYEYFGGDSVFNPLYEKIKAELLALNHITTDKIQSDAFVEILIKHLSPVIQDGHFSIDNKSFYDNHAQKYYYTVDSVPFHKDASGFFTYTKDNQKSYAKAMAKESIDTLFKTGLNSTIANNLKNGTLDEFFKPTLDKNGEFAYAPGFTSSKYENRIEIKFIFHNNTEQPLTLEPVGWGDYLQADDKEKTVFYNKHKKDGVTIIESRSFYPTGSENNTKALETFVEDAKALRDEKAIIIDLRGNSGGFAEYGARWVSNFAGVELSEVNSLGASSTLLSETVYESYPESYGEWFYEWFDGYKADGHAMPMFDTFYGSVPKKIENDTLIFVITDVETMSASEYFLTYLSLLDHVVLVGTNTGGMFTFGSVRSIYLPASGVPVFCGFNMYFLPDLQTREYVGFQPDLWIDSNESIEKVLQLLANNRP